MPAKKIKWNSERLLSLTAMVMSLVTLLIFIWQTNLMSKQNYLSILPYLQLSTSKDLNSKSFSLHLMNHGVGPAILESVVLEYEGEKYSLRDYDNHIMNLLSDLSPEVDSIRNFTYSTLDPGVAIPANSTYTFLDIRENPEAFGIITKAFDSLIGRGLRYEIVYRSLQDERWLIHNDSEGPEKLD